MKDGCFSNLDCIKYISIDHAMGYAVDFIFNSEKSHEPWKGYTMQSSQYLDAFARLFVDPSSFESSSQKSSYLSTLSCLLLQMKEQNRELYTRLRVAKQACTTERAAFDGESVGLQSVRYERAQIESEIAGCRGRRFGYERLEMVPLQEFMDGRMQDDSVEEGEQELMLARLHDELARRKALKDEVKLAEVRRDAEREKLAKLQKELESLRDNVKIIYKMAISYKLVTLPPVVPSGAVVTTVSKGPLESLHAEILAYLDSKEAWLTDLVSAHEAFESGEDEEEKEIEDEETSARPGDEAQSRHATTKQAKRTRRFDFDYIEVLPPADIFDGTVLFFHGTPSDKTSPLLVSVCSSGIEDQDTFLSACPVDASMLMRVTMSTTEMKAGVPFKWIQVAAGMESDLAFADAQRCIDVFFRALKKPEVSIGYVPSSAVDSPSRDAHVGPECITL